MSVRTYYLTMRVVVDASSERAHEDALAEIRHHPPRLAYGRNHADGWRWTAGAAEVTRIRRALRQRAKR